MLLGGIPRLERYGWRGKRERQVGWVFPPITVQELQTWAAFERVEGPILIHDRVETSMAIAAMTFASPYVKDSNRLNLSDFMPHWDPTEQRQFEQSAEDIMAAIKAMAIKNYGDGKGVDEFYGN